MSEKWKIIFKNKYTIKPKRVKEKIFSKTRITYKQRVLWARKEKYFQEQDYHISKANKGKILSKTRITCNQEFYELVRKYIFKNKNNIYPKQIKLKYFQKLE